MAWGLRAGGSGIVASVLVAAVLAGCGAGSDPGTRPLASATADPGTRPLASATAGQVLAPLPVISAARLRKDAPSTLAGGVLPEIGTTQRVDAAGSRLAVTLLRVIDPLRRSGAALPAHARAVGVLIRIQSAGPRVYDSSATGDLSLLSSAGPATPVLATRGICRTPQNDFDRYMTAGEDRQGCVVFAVADSATLDAVRFSPHAHQLGRLTWAP